MQLLLRKLALWAGFLFCTQPQAAAQWQELPFRFSGNGSPAPQTFFVDTAEDALYIGGNFTAVDNTPANLMRWDGYAATILPPVPGDQVIAITQFQGKLCVSNVRGAFWLNVNGWDTIATGYCYNLAQWNGRLVLLQRYFTDTVASGHVRLWDGTSDTLEDLYGLDTFHATPDLRPFAFAEYNGQIFIGGNFEEANGIKEILRWDGSRWTDVGGGIGGGGLAEVRDMQVWQGYLYVSGVIDEWNYGRGNGIVRWDGTHWQRLGEALYPTGSVSAGLDMCEWGGGLVVAGIFHRTGGVPARRLARWDGVRWCGFGTDSTFNTFPLKVVSFRDTLYVAGGFWELNGVPMTNPYLVRWVGGTTLDTCSAPVTITTLDMESAASGAPSPFDVHPNPSTGVYVLDFTAQDANPAAKLTVTNTAGQTVLSQPLTIRSGANRVGVDLTPFSTGVYLVRLENGSMVSTQKVVKQ